jgi:hypothetical protein
MQHLSGVCGNAMSVAQHLRHAETACELSAQVMK